LKIGADMLPLKTGSIFRGIGRYTCNLFRELIKIDSSNEYFLYNIPLQRAHLFQGPNVTVMERSPTPEDTVELDVFFITSLMELGMEETVTPATVHCRTALIFYDLIPVIFREKYIDFLNNNEYFRRLSQIKDFDLILAISQTTKRDLIQLLEVPEEKIKVVFGGLDRKFLSPRSSSRDIALVKKKYSIKNKFVLSTVGMDFRKNIDGIFQAFAVLNSQLDLVIVCKLQPQEEEHLRKQWQDLGLKEGQLILTNYIPDRDLIALTDAAEAFVFPSYYEGFGLPVLESMSRGCPVVTSRISSLPEVCESAALYVNPADPRDIAQAIDLLASDGSLRRRLAELGRIQQAKFTWERVVLETLDGLEALDQNAANKRPRPRYRIAFFTPLNPTNSGISDYSEEILVHLREALDIDVFIDSGYDPTSEAIRGQFGIYNHHKFKEMEERKGYDLCLYQVGNSRFHEYMLTYMKSYPGLMVLHDMTLCGIFLPACMKRGVFERDRFLDLVFESHGYSKYLDVKNLLDGYGHVDPYDLSINFAKKFIDHSILTLVHNQYSLKFLERQAFFTNIWKIDQPGLEGQKAADGKTSREIKEEMGLKDEIVIAAFGRIALTKRPEVLLKALARLRANKNIRNAHLLLVGEPDEDTVKTIPALIKEMNLQKAVTVTGYVSNEEFIRYIQAADICVNLRYPTAGETSATLTKALSLGLPVITSNYAQFTEYPDDCCWKVDLGEKEVDLLVEYLFELATNDRARAQMSKNALRYSRENNSMERVVGQYLAAIDYAVKRKRALKEST